MRVALLVAALGLMTFSTGCSMLEGLASDDTSGDERIGQRDRDRVRRDPLDPYDATPAGGRLDPYSRDRYDPYGDRYDRYNDNYRDRY